MIFPMIINDILIIQKVRTYILIEFEVVDNGFRLPDIEKHHEKSQRKIKGKS